MYTVNIFGNADSRTPDIKYMFDIASTMTNGAWTYNACSVAYQFNNELIPDLTENQVISAVTAEVNSILNSSAGPMWIRSPRLRLYYDDETKRPVVKYE